MIPSFFDIVLHPSHKLTYLQNAGWSEEWVATAKEIVKTEFERAYVGINEDDGGEEVSSASLVCFFSNLGLKLFLASDRTHFGQHIRQPPEPVNA